MNNNIINEQTVNYDMLEAFNSGCFDKSIYSWFTIDGGVQPKTIKETGVKVVTGVNTKNEPVWFYPPKSGEKNGEYKNKKNSNKKMWFCDVAEMKKSKETKQKELDLTKQKETEKITKQDITKATEADIQNILKKAEEQKINKDVCIQSINSLYEIKDKQYKLEPDDLTKLKNIVKACYVQKTKFLLGGLTGINDKLDDLMSDSSGVYGISLNESTLKKIVKENLNNTKTIILTESNIVKNRFSILTENGKPKNKKELTKFINNVISESTSLRNQGFDDNIITEGFLDVIGGLFSGSASQGFLEFFKEKIMSWLLDKLGVENEWMKSIVSTAFGNLQLADIPKLTNCDFVTKLLSKTAVESIIKKVSDTKLKGSQVTGALSDIVRNTMIDSIEKSDFGSSLQHNLSEFICPKLQSLKLNMDSKGEEIKNKALAGKTF